MIEKKIAEWLINNLPNIVLAVVAVKTYLKARLFIDTVISEVHRNSHDVESLQIKHRERHPEDNGFFLERKEKYEKEKEQNG